MGRKLALAALILLKVAEAPGEPHPVWRLECDSGQPAKRVFNIGRGLFQEWVSERGEFGSNLCQSFRCTGDTGRLTGSIESASLIFSVELDPGTRRAVWRTVGASGLKQTSGSCTAQPK